MEKLTNKVKILKNLLESPKTTGNIALALGYKDDKGYGKYNYISDDIKTLETKRFIHRIDSKKTVGAPGKTYDINYDISFLKELVIKYPLIVPDLQKNENIISMVADTQKLFVEHPLDSFDLETAKKMLTLSQSFFKNYISNPNFLNTFYKLWLEEEINIEGMEKYNINLDYKAGTQWNDGEWIRSYRRTSVKFEILYNAFRHSIITDKIENVYNPESLDYFRTLPDPTDIESFQLVAPISAYIDGKLPGITVSTSIRHKGFYSSRKEITDLVRR